MYFVRSSAKIQSHIKGTFAASPLLTTATAIFSLGININDETIDLGDIPSDKPDLKFTLPIYNSGNYADSLFLSWKARSSSERLPKSAIQFEPAILEIAENDSQIVSLTINATKLNEGTSYFDVIVESKYSIMEVKLKKRYNYTVVQPTSVKSDNMKTPNEFALTQNYPNPFNPITYIDYRVARDTNVQIKIYNLQGMEVKTIVDEYKKKGNYSVNWDASNLSSGIYVYKMTADLFHATKKLMVIK